MTSQHGLDRRSFLQTFLVSSAGVTTLGALPIRAPAAWVSWGPPQASLMLGDDPTPGLEPDETLEVAGGIALGDPAIAQARDGLLWIAWTEMVGDDERIFLRSLDPESGAWSEPIHVNEGQAPTGLGTLAYQPQLALGRGTVSVVWTGQMGGAHSILRRTCEIDSGALQETETLSESPLCSRPALGPRGIVVWEERVQGRFAIRGLGPNGEALEISRSPGADCRRPAVASLGWGGSEMTVAWDAHEGEGTHNIHVVRFNPGDVGTLARPHARTQITHHAASDIAPALAYAPDGSRLWIGWHSNRAGDDRWDIPRWFRLAAMDTRTGEVFEPVAPPRDRDLDKRETDQGWEFVRLVACPDGGVWVIGRPSHNWNLQRYHGRRWSPIYRLPVDGWGGRGKLAGALLDGDGALWVARRDIRACAVTRIGGASGEEAVEPVLRPLREPAGQPLANIEMRPSFPPETINEEGAGQSLEFLFGDIHGHSYMSDGMGDVEEHFARARDLHRDDFFALTDHDNFVGQRLLNSEYEEHKRVVEHFHDDGRFVTLYAQEWTTPRARASNPHGFGHINFYAATADHPLMDHLDERWDTQAKVTETAKRHGMIAGPHHVGWTGYKWDETDTDVIRFVEMCSVHGVFEHEGNEPIPHRGNASGCFVQDGLARGLKFGFVGGSDQHGLIWHHRICWKRNAYRAGLTGVLAPERTRGAIFEALANRRTFATTGVKIRLGFKINGALMGSVITSDGPPSLHVDLVSPTTDIRWVDIIRSNERIVRYGGESLHTFFTFVDDDCPEREEVWYYLRVILDDGNMAWSSPIWVTRRG